MFSPFDLVGVSRYNIKETILALRKLLTVA